MRASRVAFFAALAAWIAYALYYVISSQPPHSFASDLGYSIVGVGRIASLATSWQNVTDMIGWETWNDFPSFLYAPGGQYVLAVPVGALLGDPIRTVKLEQIVTLTIAFFGMASLYCALFGKTRARWFAAFLYTAMPLSSIMVQWDGDFAWIVALAPCAPLAALQLGRRFGAVALPAAGLLCAIATFAFSPEQGLTLGLPLLVVTFALYMRENIAVSPLGIAAALAAWALFPAFVILPTLYGAHPMWWAPGTLSEFDSDTSGLRTLFGQGPLELIGGVYREQLVSANSIFNVSRSLPYAVAGGAAALILAGCAFLYRGTGAALRRWWPAVAAGALCVLLACGTRLPLIGSFLWNDVIVHVPLLSALRTPDRFIQIAALLISLAAAYGLRRGFEKGGSARRWVVAAAVVTVAGYAAFFVREGVLGFADPGQLPDFAAINASVEGLGGRTAVYAFPRGGSPLDFAAYAPKSATAEFTWSVMQRHVDEDGGVALLRRASVRSIVTSPNWTQPSIDGMPADMAEPIERSSFAHPAFAGQDGARVFRVDGSRERAVAATPVCTDGGPAGFEFAAGEQFLETAALMHGTRQKCARTVLADADPLDAAIPAQAVAMWVGAELFGNLGFPAPDKFEINRMQLAAPWYRDAYGGDSLLTGKPLITEASGSSNLVPFTIARRGKYSVFVRASGPASLSARLASGAAAYASSERARGFRWVELPLGELAPGRQTLELAILRFVTLAQKVVIDEVAVAPSAIVLPHEDVDAAIVTAREFVPPAGIDARAPLYLFPRMDGAGFSADVPNVQAGPGTQIGLIGGEPAIQTSLPRTRIRFRWEGPTGTYVASVAALLAGGGSHDVVSSPTSSFESRYDVTLTPTPAFGVLKLKNGDPLDVTLTTPGSGANALTQLVLLPVRTGAEPPTEYDERGETWRFDANYSLFLIEAMRSPHVSMIAGTMRAPAGTSVEIPFHPSVTGGTVAVDLRFSGGNGRATLRCGNSSDAVDIGAGTLNPSSADLSLARSTDTSCALGIEWHSSDFQLKFAHVRATGRTLLGWTAPQYFASGSYRWDCAGSNRVVLSVDGARWKVGEARHFSAGVHRLTLERAPAPPPALQFYREGAWPLPAPPAVSIVQHSSTGWTAHPTAPATLEIAELNDGNWFARGPSATTPGYDCDLVNTCFDVSGSQEVTIGRRLPRPLALGFAISFADVFVVGLLLLARRQVRSVRSG